MDTLDLLREWPSWRKAGAGKILSSPAWRLDILFDDRPGILRTAVGDASEDLLWLEVKLEDERHILGISDSVAFSELHKVWALREKLPPEVRMALVERDCAPLFQMLEDSLRRQFSVVGFAEGPEEARVRMFEAVVADTEQPIAFALDFSSAMEIDFGRLENLDTSHPSIREMTREVEAEYAQIPFEGETPPEIAEGDLLLEPEGEASRWVTELPANEPVFRVLGAARHTLTFAQLVDGTESVPATESYRIVCGEREIATAARSDVGTHPAYRVEKLKG